MKAAVSIPDPVFKRADALARRLKRSRSSVYTDALREYLERHDENDMTAALTRALRGLPRRDPFTKTIVERTLRDIEWND